MTDSQSAPENKDGGESVDCDGGGGALGHPLVYLTFDADGHVVCPYCGREFERDPASAAAH